MADLCGGAGGSGSRRHGRWWEALRHAAVVPPQTAPQTAPQGCRHRDAVTGMPPQGCSHRDAVTGMPPQGCSHRDAVTGMPPQGCRHRDAVTGRADCCDCIAELSSQVPLLLVLSRLPDGLGASERGGGDDARVMREDCRACCWAHSDGKHVPYRLRWVWLSQFAPLGISRHISGKVVGGGPIDRGWRGWTCALCDWLSGVRVETLPCALSAASVSRALRVQTLGRAVRVRHRQLAQASLLLCSLGISVPTCCCQPRFQRCERAHRDVTCLLVVV